MSPLVPKQYEINIIIPKKILLFRYQKKIQLKYQTATLRETLVYEYNVKTTGNFPITRLINFIREKSNRKIGQTDMFRIAKNINSVIDILYKTYFPQPSGIIFPKSDGRMTEWAPFSAYIVSVAKSLNLDPVEMAKKYTQEQIDFLMLGLVWNANEITEEWRKNNSGRVSAERNKNLINEKWEEIQKIFKQLIKE